MPRTPEPAPLAPGVRTFPEFLRWLGDIPADRILMRPPPGMATANDVLRVGRQDNLLCECVGGTLIEKRLGYREASIAGALLAPLERHVAAKNLGVVTGAEGAYRLSNHLVRIPAVAFCAAGTFPGDTIPGEAAPDTIPQFVVEVPGSDSTPGEVALRLEDYFTAGVKQVWVVDLEKRAVLIHTSPAKSKSVPASGTLETGRVVGNFKLAVATLFEPFGLRKKVAR
jgi:hypothetical protein